MCRIKYFSLFLTTSAACVSANTLAASGQNKAVPHPGPTYEGKATWFNSTAGDDGACNYPLNKFGDNYIALNPLSWVTGGIGSNCGRKINITNKDNGISGIGYVTDFCALGCITDQLDLHLPFWKLFEQDIGKGVLSTEWYFLD